MSSARRSRPTGVDVTRGAGEVELSASRVVMPLALLVGGERSRIVGGHLHVDDVSARQVCQVGRYLRERTPVVLERLLAVLLAAQVDRQLHGDDLAAFRVPVRIVLSHARFVVRKAVRVAPAVGERLVEQLLPPRRCRIRTAGTPPSAPTPRAGSRRWSRGRSRTPRTACRGSAPCRSPGMPSGRSRAPPGPRRDRGRGPRRAMRSVPLASCRISLVVRTMCSVQSAGSSWHDSRGDYLTLASALACSPMLSTQAMVMVSPLPAPMTSAER